MKEEYYFRSSIMNALLYNLSEDEAKEMMTTIEVIGAADVAPVVHAHWKYFYNGCYYIGVCSNCGKQMAFTETNDGVPHGYPHCPHCGAKMDESEDENE